MYASALIILSCFLTHVEQGMYQSELMWISFAPTSQRTSAVKISVGGVNPLTGLSQNQRTTGKQDYLEIDRNSEQL